MAGRRNDTGLRRGLAFGCGCWKQGELIGDRSSDIARTLVWGPCNPHHRAVKIRAHGSSFFYGGEPLHASIQGLISRLHVDERFVSRAGRRQGHRLIIALEGVLAVAVHRAHAQRAHHHRHPRWRAGCAAGLDGGRVLARQTAAPSKHCCDFHLTHPQERVHSKVSLRRAVDAV